MTTEKIVTLFKNAGFNTQTSGANVIISLNNRTVDMMEIEWVLGDAHVSLKHSGSTIIATPMTIANR